MAKQNETKSQQKLDGYSRRKLGSAYMSLYDALVAECQAQHMTLGKSWYNALQKISDIIESKKNGTQSYVSDYLMKFFMSHRDEQIKKMMEDKAKDSTIVTSKENTIAAAARVRDEIKKFDDVIKSVSNGEVLTVLQPVDKSENKGFYNWVEQQPEGIVVDFDDPHSFERAYRRYIMQQKNK